MTIDTDGRQTVSAGYNFVPLSERVFLPDWAAQVSHDVPFSDGLSGEIDCELITESPVYVRNGIDKDPETAKKDPAYTDFFEVDGKFLIPGSSLKGMFRNVLEIASFGKMPQRVDDHRYAVRDLANPDPHLYRDRMTSDLGEKTYEPKSSAAWLERDPESYKWYLVPCEFARIEHSDLSVIFGGSLDLKRDRPSAGEKYQRWGTKSRQITFDLLPDTHHPHRRGAITLVYRKVDVSTIGKGKQDGTLVFTGQPGPNKHLEFVFHNTRAQERAPVSPELRTVFEFVHSDPSSGKPNAEWGFWKEHLERGERVPVFYLGDISAPSSMGLALMYRLAYTHSVHGMIRHTDSRHQVHFCDEPDLTDLLFGYLSPKGERAGSDLKGRVHVSQARAIAAEPMEAVVATVLGGPKPGFYPNYIQQSEGARAYKTFMDSDARIRGWKRYPARRVSQKLPDPPPKSSDEVQTRLRPLKAGARFSFKVRFHNLRPAELGALWWTLTWGEDEHLRHTIGMGKAHGMGQCCVRVTKRIIETVAGKACDDVGMASFFKLMHEEIGGDWEKSSQIVQLRAMADPNFVPRTASGSTQPDSAQREKLAQMRLEMGGANEFKEAKQAEAYLLPHARWSGKELDWSPRRKAANRHEGVDEKPTLPATLQDRLNAIRAPNKKGQFLDLLRSLTANHASDLDACDFGLLGNIFNIGDVDEFLGVELDPVIRRVAAAKVLAMITRSPKWDDAKLARFERLRTAAS